MKSELIENIRRKRNRQKSKRAFEPSLFTRIAVMVRMRGGARGLRESFDAAAFEKEISVTDTSFRGPLFALVTAEEYEEIAAVSAAIENAQESKGKG